MNYVIISLVKINLGDMIVIVMLYYNVNMVAPVSLAAHQFSDSLKRTDMITSLT